MKDFPRWRTLVGTVVLVAAAFSYGLAQVYSPLPEQPARDERAEKVRQAFQLVFFSVLEGCFQDGLTDEDVKQILLTKTPESNYEHFIYACPICDATARALEAYLARPNSHMKVGPRKLSFGKGITPELHARLFSSESKQRLAALHDLEEAWVLRRVASLRLAPEELARTQENLKLARENGIHLMQSFAQQGELRRYAPDYQNGDECALCNAAAGMKLKLAEAPPK